MPLGVDHINGSTHDIFKPEIWSMEGIRAREKSKVMSRLVQDRSNEVAGKGDVLNIQSISNMSANPKANNTQVSLQAPSEANTTITVNRFFESSFLVETILSRQSQMDLQKEYTPKSAEAVERQKDTDLLSTFATFTQKVGSTSTSGNAVTEANFVRAIQYLDDADAPQTERYFVGRPVAKADMLKINKFTGVTIGADATSPGTVRSMNILETGEFGQLYGVGIYISTNVAEDGTTAGLYHNLMFHREAVGLATQIETSTDVNYIPEYIGYLTTSLGLWGYNVLRNNHGVDFRSA
jgi:hypothetical protein